LWTVPVDEGTGIASGPPRLRMQSTGLADHASVTKDGRRVVFANATGGSTILRWEFDPSSERITPNTRTHASLAPGLNMMKSPYPDGKLTLKRRH